MLLNQGKQITSTFPFLCQKDVSYIKTFLSFQLFEGNRRFYIHGVLCGTINNARGLTLFMHVLLFRLYCCQQHYLEGDLIE